MSIQAAAQQQSSPQVKVNVLNVCTPSEDEQKEIANALSRIPKQPAFSDDFEVDRGRSTLSGTPDFLQAGGGAQMSPENSTSTWVRIRRDFQQQSWFSTVQYSFSVDKTNMIETLVFRVRDPKDLLQVSIEDSASAVTSPSAMLSTSTPANHIKLERFGKSSVALARCQSSENSPGPDQSAYEPLFRSATGILDSYRTVLRVRSTVPNELARVQNSSTGAHKIKTKPGPARPVVPAR